MNRWIYKIKNLGIWIHDFIFPYNVIRIRTLGRSYQENDDLMLHAAFTILCSFVEKEVKVCKLENEPSFSEVMELYHWWKVVRPTEMLLLEKLLDDFHKEHPDFSPCYIEREPDTNLRRVVWREEDPVYQEWHSLVMEHAAKEDSLYKKDSEMLSRLVAIRPSLWL